MTPARALYSAITWLAQPLLRAKLRRRAATEPGYGVAVEERFGHYPQAMDSLAPISTTGLGNPFVWVHAVSLGETRAAAILLAELRQLLPGMRLLLTHGTATGRAEGEKLLQPGDVQVWQPWDTPGAVRRFLQQFRPEIGILMETEIWPNLLAGCRQRGIPVVLANARLNAKSLAGARRLSWLSRPAYAGLAAAWAQTEADAERLRAAGARVQGVFGNLKFDVVPDAAQLAQGREWRDATGRRVVLLASSREGEEAMWLDALQSKRPPAQITLGHHAINSGVSGAGASAAALPVQWLVVPRHPQRFAQVRELIEAAGLTVSPRSTWGAAPGTADVWLGDSLGEMALYYGLSHAALLGGSYAPLGGQNLIEAAACGCPVVTGPHTFNFAEAARLACEAGAALRVKDMAEGVAVAEALVGDAPRLEEAQGRAVAFTSAHRGAALATALAVAQMLRVQVGGSGEFRQSSPSIPNKKT
ncbi:3-deoxy-D-manno-octulosonic acid transferase [Acidovorax sp. BLS4]|uniref:3-deoxy-D-manno-octulosonic acid transferase n=1 Tax=Acidovorax sp. BLS4 TaxID=3273430 RepID=UPI002943F3B3|nr:3-deoxy-D-manno-octulosonic acid transferase [Paracidovorax avenae]WOI45076.1 3-deoxy-D-manno-octulosonic acid transferase [Paracidovorax avenae]